MGTGRFWATAIAVWLVRTVMNALFYGVLLAPRLAAVAAQHPGMFRTVVPAYVAADLLFGIVFTLLFSKVGAALGGGITGGIALGLFVAILAPAIASVYEYYSVTYVSAKLQWATVIYQVFAHIVQGIIAGALYKTGVSARGATA